MIVKWAIVIWFWMIAAGLLIFLGVMGYSAHNFSKHAYWVGVFTPFFVVAIIWFIWGVYKNIVLK